MDARARVNEIFRHGNQAGSAMWTGHPNDKFLPLFAKTAGIEPTREAIFKYLNDVWP